MALRLAGERYPSEGIFDTVTITDGAGHYLQVPKLTTAQRDALAPTNGMIIYNTTTGRFEAYDGGWDALNIANILTTKGDLFIRGASDIERLAIGTKRFFLRVNEAGDGLEYVRGYEFGPALTLWQAELDFYEWTTSVTGSGNVAGQRYGLLDLRTGATAGSTAAGRGFSMGWPDWDNDWEWFTRMLVSSMSANGKAWYKVDILSAADPAIKSVGWRLDGFALKGIVHNGTSLTVVDLSTTLTGGVVYSLFLKFIAGDKIEWYVNGVLKGSSSSIPSSYYATEALIVMSIANGADADDNICQIRYHYWVGALT